MIRVAYFPVVENQDQLLDILSRAAWFLTFSPIEKIYVFLDDGRLADSPWRVAPGMDPDIAQRFDVLRRMIEFVPARSEADLAPAIEQVSVVLRWNQNACPEWLSETTLASWLSRREVYEVDADAVRTEAGNYINVSYKLGPSTSQLGAENQARFAALSRQLGRHERAAILATGPSVGDYGRFEYDDALGIVCNTVILDQQLMETVRPKLAVFLDPNFHFGPSQYAARFRANLRRAAETFDFTICIPLKYHAVFAAAVPELVDRTIALPFQMERDFNFDLASDFELKTTANVLTFVMVPLATTFAGKVSILGCDGRPLDEDTYFWRHNQATQLNDEMANVRTVHPGFFKLDYNDYYLEHCQTLEEQLSAGERAGYRFESLADSHIPALKRRIATPARADSATTERESDGAGEGDWPRLLVIDSTRVGGPTATGQLKRNFLLKWPGDAYLQICAPRGDRYQVTRSLDGDPTNVVLLDENAIHEEVAAFHPDVIYYRPTIDQHPGLHGLAVDVLARQQAPLVTHLMDDWPSRLAASDAARAREVDRELRLLLSKSDKVLSISDKMSKTFGSRYGVSFEALANGIDPNVYRDVSASAKPEKKGREEVVLRYCGALAKDMTFQTLVDVAHAVDSLSKELPLRLEVYTMPMWRAAFEEAINGLRGTSVLNGVFGEGFPPLLAGADILVLGYNFDEDSLRYVRLSVPNKLPEYLASGAAVLAVGPREANGIEVVQSRRLACCVTERDPEKLAGALRHLASDPDYRDELASRAQAWAFEHRDVDRIARRFETILREAAEGTSSPESVEPLVNGSDSRSERPGDAIVGPLTREHKATVDETYVVAKLFGENGRNRTMIDVGAHRGSSLAPFAATGWMVLAFEPDESNRRRLTKRFGKHDNVTIDPRAVSEKPATGAAFFSSEESTGISALHAFRDTHEQVATVDVTTVGEIVEAHGLSDVDFLKIDVEGFDWDVIKGVPWDGLNPDVIECEFEDAKTIARGHTYRNIADYLVEKGYAVYLSEWHPIIRYGIRHEWRQLVRYPTVLGSADAWGNVLAFREDPGIDRIRAAFTACLEVENPAAELVAADPAVEPVHSDPAAEPIDPGLAAATPVDLPSREEWTAPRVDAKTSPSRPRSARFAKLVRRRAKKDGPMMPTRRSLYERLYISTKARNPFIFYAGRLAMWCGRKARRYPVWTFAYLALLGSLLTVGFLPATDPYAPVAFSIAGLVVAVGMLVVMTGFASFLLKEARHEAQQQHLAVRRRLERAETFLRSGQKSRIALEVRLEDLRSEQVAAKDALALRVGELQSEQVAAKDALALRVGELQSEQATAKDAIDEVQSEQAKTNEALETEIGEVRSNYVTAKDAIALRVGELQSEQATAKDALETRIREVGAKQATAVDALEARIGELQSEHATAKDAFETRIRELGANQATAVDALEARIGELQSEHATAKDAFEAGIGKLRSAQASAKDALEAEIGELQSEQATSKNAFESQVRELGAEQQKATEALMAEIDELLSEQTSTRGALVTQLGELGREREASRQALEAKITELLGEQESAKEALVAQIGELEREQASAKEALEAKIVSLEARNREAKKTLGQARRSLNAKIENLEGGQWASNDELEASRQALEAKITELLGEQESAKDALVAQIGELERKRKGAAKALEDKVVSLVGDQQRGKGSVEAKVNASTNRLRRHVSLRIAQMEARSASFGGLLLLIAPERSGSTWLFDLLRCHPAAMFYPVADVYRQLEINGRRYPMHLSDGADATLDIEVQDGIGATVPAFDVNVSRLTPDMRFAVEKVHPSAIRFDTRGFLGRINQLEAESEQPIQCCYLVRDPVDSLRSFLAYKQREPGWRAETPDTAEPDLYLRSFEVLQALASNRPGPVIRYEELVADPIDKLSKLYRLLWPEIDWQTNLSIAAQAMVLTGRDKRIQSQSGKFLGDLDEQNLSDVSILLGTNDEVPERSQRALDECRRLYEQMVMKDVELPSAIDD